MNTADTADGGCHVHQQLNGACDRGCNNFRCGYDSKIVGTRRRFECSEDQIRQHCLTNTYVHLSEAPVAKERVSVWVQLDLEPLEISVDPDTKITTIEIEVKTSFQWRDWRLFGIGRGLNASGHVHTYTY
jgi:hypothetical protein